MNRNSEVKNIEQLLAKIDESVDDADDKVTVDDIMDHVGHRSFGPLLLVAGIITLMPVIGDIPGVPGIMGIFVFLIAVQLIFHAEHFWLPDWLLNRSVEPDKLRKALDWIRKPAQFIDRYIKPRYTSFTKGTAVYVIAAICLLIAIAMPFMELVPFSANGAGAALTAFGLGLIAHDGLLSIIAFVFTVVTAGVVVYNLI